MRQLSVILLLMVSYCLMGQAETENDELTKLRDKVKQFLGQSGQLDSAKILFPIIEEMTDMSDPYQKSMYMELEALILYKSAEYEKAAKIYKEKDILDSINNLNRLRFTNIIQQSNVYYYQGNYIESIKYDIACIRLARKEKNYVMCARCLQNKATNHHLIGQLEQARLTYEEAFEELEKVELTAKVATALHLLRSNYTKLLMLEEDYEGLAVSVKAHEELFAKYDSVQPMFKASLLSNKGFLLSLENYIDSALYYNAQAINILKKNNYTFEVIRDYHQRAKYFFDDNQLDSAYFYATSSLKGADTLNLLHLQYYNHGIIAEIYSKRNRPD